MMDGDVVSEVKVGSITINAKYIVVSVIVTLTVIHADMLLGF